MKGTLIPSNIPSGPKHVNLMDEPIKVQEVPMQVELGKMLLMLLHPLQLLFGGLTVWGYYAWM